jgi:hypothetical protein
LNGQTGAGKRKKRAASYEPTVENVGSGILAVIKPIEIPKKSRLVSEMGVLEIDYGKRKKTEQGRASHS